MENFWEYNVWSFIVLFATLLLSLLVANFIKKTVPFLRNSLIPTSVLGGLLLLLISSVYELFAGISLFDTGLFGNNGMNVLEIITYHSLALGFIATIFKPGKPKFSRERTRDIIHTGVTTVSSYLLQAVFGLGLTLLWALVVPGFFRASGVLLCFGFGQGTGQALNWGGVYQADWGFEGGRSFGLTIAALGFLSASIGGVIHLALLKRKYHIERVEETAETISIADIQTPDEIPMNGSIDKLTVQLGLVFGTYIAAYVLIYILGESIPKFKTVLYGFNFLFGVLCASGVMWALRFLRRVGVVKKEYVNPFLMKRISGFFFDLMIVAGIAAIRIQVLKQYWLVILVLALGGTLLTYFYNLFISKKFFPEYDKEQFLVMYGMLTGTASTGIILLREIDPDFKTPAAENLVYQNFPAIVLGFPLMLLANLAPEQPLLVLAILAVFFAALNVFLFRSVLFKRKK